MGWTAHTLPEAPPRARRRALYMRSMAPRRKTRQITLGDDRVGRVRIGGDAPIAVQTMTAGYTHDIDACVA